MDQNLKDKLARRIQVDYPFERARAEAEAEQLLRRCPPQLLGNVTEWAEGRPLSPFAVDNYTLALIMHIWGTPDFLEAVDAMIQLMEGDKELALCRIWRGRR